jgi:hypothetical protein
VPKNKAGSRWLIGATAALRIALLLFAISASSLAAFAQQASCTQREIPVAVVGNDLLPVMGLPASSFRAKIDGKPATIISVSPNQRSPSVVLLLDISLDMKRLPKGWLLNKSEYLLSQLPTTLPVGLATFSDKLTPMVAPTLDHEAIRSQLEKLREKEQNHALFSGKTELWTALRANPPLLENPQHGDVIYLITAGRKSLGNGSSDGATDAVLNAGVRLYAIIYVPSPLGTYAEYAALPPSSEVIRTGGAAVMFPLPYDHRRFRSEDDNEESRIRLDVIRITNFYHVVMEFSKPLEKPRDMEITVTGTNKDEAPFFWHYPHKLMPCNPLPTP